MTINKDMFDKYAKDRESVELSKAIENKKKFTHNKAFSRIGNDDKRDAESSLKPNIEQLLLVKTSEIINWEFHDRPKSELGDIPALADDFKNVGQQQPCIVRPTSSTSKYKYELIIGERRWRAARLADIDLKVIVKYDMSDTNAALAQAAENDNRIGLSDYAKGLSFSRLIEDKIIKQKDLIDTLGKSKQYISALLSYSKIPTDVINAIGDMSKVKYFAAEKIKQLSLKGDRHQSALIEIGKIISDKGLSSLAIEKEVNKILSGATKETSVLNSKVLSRDGRHLFTWRKDNNDMPSLHFPKQIISLINDNKIDFNELTKSFMDVVENKISIIKK
jgi:ParB family chromosome partitioning protein